MCALHSCLLALMGIETAVVVSVCMPPLRAVCTLAACSTYKSHAVVASNVLLLLLLLP